MIINKDIKEFISGEWIQQIEYKSFAPSKINNQWTISDPEIMSILSEADRNIGRLDAFSELIPDIDFFIKMHIAKEATFSSKIEGTQTSFEEVLIKQENINPEKRDDWKEVHNYIDAINKAILWLEDLPISNRLIKNTHKILLEGARGRCKYPGKYRESQNWIGSSLKNAVFVPPFHEEIPELMRDIENFINTDLLPESIFVPHLIKIAIIHYQFETIRPFLDRNGRIGRLLITLYLMDKKLLRKPTLYLSDFFERNRRSYYDKLSEVRNFNDLSGWIKFFLEGVVETSHKSIQTFQEIIKLRENILFNKLPNFGKKQVDANRLLNELYKQPILDSKQIAELLDIHASTANRLIDNFQKLGILRELTGYKRNRIFAFDEYIHLFNR